MTRSEHTVRKLEVVDDLEHKRLKMNSFELFDMVRCLFFIKLCSQNGQGCCRNLAANAAISLQHTCPFWKQLCIKVLKVQFCKLYNNKCMIALTQIAISEIFALIAVPVFKLLTRKVLFISRKDNRNC